MSSLRCFACSLAFAAQGFVATASPIAFDAPRDYIAGAASVAVGDFNGDGKPDVVAAGRTIRLLIGNGDASLQPPIDVVSGRAPFLGLAVSDFNADGAADVAAVLNDAVGEVLILLGNGDGSFEPAVSYFVGSSPMAIVVADFDGDRVPDLATANSASGGASALFGNGDGTFQAAVPVDVGPRPTSLVVSDFNGDSKLDLAATNFWDQRLSTAFGRGDGSFEPPTSFDTGFPSYAAVALDFTGDGHQDLILLAPHDRALSYYQGGGDGTFIGYGHWGTGNNEARSAIVADFNGDSRADTAMAYYPSNPPTDPSFVVVDFGDDVPLNGAISNVRGRPSALAAADFDGDSRLDLVIGSMDSSVVGVVHGTGDGRFIVTAGTIADGSVTATGDLNNDGKQDLVAVDGILLGNGDGSFQPRINFPQQLTFSQSIVADVDGDMTADLVGVIASGGGAISNGVLVLKGNGDGTFELTTPIASGLGAGGITVADFDGDARLDLAFSIAHLQPCPRCLPEQGWIALLRGRGDGTFEPPTLFSDVLHPFSLVTGDFNGDLRMDFAALNAQYYGSIQFLSVFLNNGDGTFRSVNMPSAWRLVGLAAGDFDSDRRTDLAVKVASAGYYPYMTYRNALAIILSLGDGAFRMSHSFPTIGSEDFTIPVAADFDGDLDLDLAITLPSAGVVGVWSGNGDGTFDPAALLFNVGALSRSAIAADFNGDSKPDLVTDGRKEHPDGNAPAIRLLTNTTPWLNSVEP